MRIQIAGVHKYQILTSLAIKINSKWPTKCARTFSRSDYFYCFFFCFCFVLFICISCHATEVHISVSQLRELGRGRSLTWAPMCHRVIYFMAPLPKSQLLETLPTFTSCSSLFFMCLEII